MKSRPYRICITGARTTYNYGTMSIIASGVEEVDRLLEGNAEFFIMSPNADIDDVNYRRTIFGSKFKTVGPKFRCGVPYFAHLLIMVLKSIPVYAKSDIVLDMRGEGYVGSAVAVTQSFQMLLARLFGTPFVIYAQSIGPFRSRINRVLARLTLKRASLITIREPISMGFFADLRIKRNAHQVADQAIMLTPAPAERIDLLLKENSLSPGDNIVGISPIPRQVFIEMAAKAADQLVEKYGVKVMIAPHANDWRLGGCKGNDDLSAAQSLLNAMAKKDCARIISGDYTAREVKGLMGRCQIYISFRWHAAIASISICNPTVVINSAHKSAAVRQFGVADLIIDPEKVTLQLLAEKVDDCWRRRAEIRSSLESRSSEMQALSRKSAELSVAVLRGG